MWVGADDVAQGPFFWVDESLVIGTLFILSKLGVEVADELLEKIKNAYQDDAETEENADVQALAIALSKYGNSDKNLYHYTNFEGFTGILASRKINPSIPDPKLNGNNAAHGPGQYFTDIPPELVLPGQKSDIAQEKLNSGFMSVWQLARKLYTSPWKNDMVEYFLEINVEGLELENPRIFVFLHRTECPLDISDRLIRSGPTL